MSSENVLADVIEQAIRSDGESGRVDGEEMPRAQAELIEAAIRQAEALVVVEGVTMFGETMCPHCLGDADAVFWNDAIAGEDGLCECCGGAGNVLVLRFVE